MSTRTQLTELLSAYCTVSESDEDALNIDSLSLIQVIEEIETAWAIRVRPTEASLANFGTFGRVLAFVESRLP